MTHLSSTVLAASTVKSIGAVIAVITGIGFVWYVAANIRAGRDEVAAEIELAPNRKPYYDDEGLEGPRLTRALSTGLVLLGVVAVGLPLYWLNEGMLDVLVRGQGPAAVLLPMVVLAGFAAVLTLLAARLFRWETN